MENNDKITCKKCGRLNASKNKCCVFCGADLETGISKYIKCRNCGLLNLAEGKICLHCGEPLLTDTPFKNIETIIDQKPEMDQEEEQINNSEPILDNYDDTNFSQDNDDDILEGFDFNNDNEENDLQLNDKLLKDENKTKTDLFDSFKSTVDDKNPDFSRTFIVICAVVFILIMCVVFGSKKEKVYNITYNNVKGAYNPNATSYTENDYYIYLSSLEIDGYRFLGWYTDTTYINEVEGIPSGSVGNIELYAKWEEIKETTNYDSVTKVKITSKVKKLNIRSTPTTQNTNNIVGSTSAGNVYTVYDTYYGEGYTWYKIGTNRWIANNGEWVEIIND